MPMEFQTEQTHDHSPGSVVLRGKYVVLRQIEPSDFGFLQEIETAGDRLVTYRHRGVTPGPAGFQQSLFASVLAQFIVTRLSNGEPLGLVVAYSSDNRNGFARVAVVGAPSLSRVGWAAEGWELFIDYLFQAFPFRKLYADVLEFNLDQFRAGVLRYFEVEGRLREHEYFNDRYWDLLILALYRDDWRQRDRSRLAAAVRQREAVAEAG